MSLERGSNSTLWLIQTLYSSTYENPPKWTVRTVSEGNQFLSQTSPVS